MLARFYRLLRPLGSRELLNWLPDKTYLKLVYKGYIGERLDLDNPKGYNEKIQWLKLFYREPELTIYADKYKVREFISNRIGSEYLIPLIGVYDSVNDIDWGKLPNKFVLKCNHGSGTNVICHDKSELNIKNVKKKLHKWMKRNWYWYGREWVYKNIKPKIICERFLKTEDGKLPIDYKFMCFNGKVKMIQVFTDREDGTFKKDFYTIEWNKTNIVQGAPNSRQVLKKPENLDLMINLSEKLSKELPFVRVDFYEVKGKVYFGELTFYPASGFKAFENKKYDNMFGKFINLPKRIHH